MDDNRKKALGAALAQIEKQFGTGSIMRMGANTARDMRIDVAVKNNFGFGGTNGTLVFKRLQ